MRSQSLPDARAGAIAVCTPPDLRFAKYSMCGNTFLIVDETVTPLGSDPERAAFARWALDSRFGVGGSDNVLYLQEPPRPGPRADVALRVFEHDGSETLSCGNGLLSVAALMRELDSRDQWVVLTELPSGAPRPVSVGVGSSAQEMRVDFGRPRAVPNRLFTGDAPSSSSGIARIEDLLVPLACDDAGEASAGIVLSGFLIFTGEPHLVVLAGHGLSGELTRRILPDRDTLGGEAALDDSAAAESDRLMHRIGRSVNETYRRLFPAGVHLDFAKVRDAAGLIEYRTYERAIDRETLSCGSGAVATVAVARWLGLLSGSETRLWPHRCRRHLSEATLAVSETTSGFVLRGSPQLVYSGVVARGAFA